MSRPGGGPCCGVDALRVRVEVERRVVQEGRCLCAGVRREGPQRDLGEANGREHLIKSDRNASVCKEEGEVGCKRSRHGPARPDSCRILRAVTAGDKTAASRPGAIAMREHHAETEHRTASRPRGGNSQPQGGEPSPTATRADGDSRADLRYRDRNHRDPKPPRPSATAPAHRRARPTVAPRCPAEAESTDPRALGVNR